MLTIRLKRMGRTNKPLFRVVVMEKHKSTQAKFVEVLGHFNPKDKEKSLTLHKERILHWLQVGATASPTVNNMLVDAGLLKGGKVSATRGKKKKKETAEEGGDATKAEDKPKEEAQEGEKAPEAGEKKEAVAEEKPQEEKADKPATEKSEKLEEQKEGVQQKNDSNK